MKAKLPALLSLALLLLFSTGAEANAEDFYVCNDAQGRRLFTLAEQMHEGDEYISRDNTLYRVISISGHTATAENVGTEDMPDVSWLKTGTAQPVFSQWDTALPAASRQTDEGGKRLIAMYVTHSDESYIDGDGTQSIEGQGGIYDVARDFCASLQALGVDVILDESTHLPHDSGAYRRSRQTAERLLQRMPDAIIDIHRDGIPDKSEYTTTLEGQPASQVRLLVGRGNQNSDANRAFAKEIKAVADEMHPELIKDIFIGKGTYNQDLSPNAILLEFGTHTIDKDRVLASTDAMADVLTTALYGAETSAAANEPIAQTVREGEKAKNRGSASGIIFLVVALIVGLLLFALLQTGGGSGMKRKLSRTASEVTGGLFGKKPED